jgi:hypothetical protein
MDWTPQNHPLNVGQLGRARSIILAMEPEQSRGKQAGSTYATQALFFGSDWEHNHPFMSRFSHDA